MRRRKNAPPRPRYLYVYRWRSGDHFEVGVKPSVLTYAEIDLDAYTICYTAGKVAFPGLRPGQTKRFAVVPA